MSVSPRKANDALHLSLLEGCDLSHEALGEVVLQESFQVWDPKNVIIRKAKERHIFLFESNSVALSTGQSLRLAPRSTVRTSIFVKVVENDIFLIWHVETIGITDTCFAIPATEAVRTSSST